MSETKFLLNSSLSAVLTKFYVLYQFAENERNAILAPYSKNGVLEVSAEALAASTTSPTPAKDELIKFLISIPHSHLLAITGLYNIGFNYEVGGDDEDGGELCLYDYLAGGGLRRSRFFGQSDKLRLAD